jgi:hypothetical protein
MANRETLLRLLTEYNVALERLRQEQEQASRDNRLNEYSTRTISKQLSYLEYRVLQLETQLSIIDIDVNDPSRGRFKVDSGGNIFNHLNPWHPNFRIWTYVTTIAILMLSVIVFNIVSAFSLF